MGEVRGGEELLAREIEAHQRSDVRRAREEPRVAKRRFEFAGEVRHALGEDRQVVRGDVIEHGNTGGRGERIARQRARLVDGTERRQGRENLFRSTERPDRKSPADDFAKTPEVRPHREVLLGSAAGQAKARDDLVEDQQRADSVTLFAQALQEARERRDEVHVGGDRFDEDRRDRVVERRYLVVGSDDGVFDRALGDPGRTGQSHLRDATTAGDEQRVGVAVITAVELHDFVAPGRTTRETHRAHHGLGTGRDESNLFETRDARGHRFGQQHLAGRRCAKGGTE